MISINLFAVGRLDLVTEVLFKLSFDEEADFSYFSYVVNLSKLLVVEFNLSVLSRF